MMRFYWVYVDGKKFAFSWDREQAENIAAANGGIVVEKEV